MWQSLVTIGQASSEIRRRKKEDDEDSTFKKERNTTMQHFIRPTLRQAMAAGRPT